MGFVRESFGNITIEQRRESFIVTDNDGAYVEFSNSDLDSLMAALIDLKKAIVS
jgi:hypothetical protein